MRVMCIFTFKVDYVRKKRLKQFSRALYLTQNYIACRQVNVFGR